MTELATFDAPVPAPIKRVVALGQGLELWYVPLDLLREQDINAQVQSKAMFDRLTATVKRDSRLEALPFCAAVIREVRDDQATQEAGSAEPMMVRVVTVEIISGHHRVRAAIAASFDGVYVIVDVTGLSRDAIAAKQLAHNSIHGTSDEALMRKIYETIQDAESRLEAFVPADMVVEIPKASVPDIDFKIDYETVLVTFLPTERAVFEKAAEFVVGAGDAAYVCDMERYEEFKAIVHRLSSEYDIRSMGTIMSRMAEIVLRALGQSPPDQGVKSLRDVFGFSFLPNELADAVKRKIGDEAKDGDKAAALARLLGV